MFYQGSYLNGFAPRDFEPVYPELWRGCVGAWCPSLGPTGGVLRDWSGRQNHGTLTNTTLDTVWANQQGYCLAPDGTDDYVTSSQSIADYASVDWTALAWFKPASLGLNNTIIGWGNGATPPFEYWLVCTNADNTVKFQAFNGSNQFIASVGTIVSGWNHIGVSWSSGTAELFLNAASVATGSVSVGTRTIANTIGFPNYASAAGYFSGSIDDIRIYNRVLSSREISLLYSSGRGRGIAYSFNQPRGSLTPGDSGSSGGTFPGLAWRALRKWRFAVRAGMDGSWPRVT